MAYQILDLDNKIIETIQTTEEVLDLFKQCDEAKIDYQLFWYDVDLVDRIKSSTNEENYKSYRIVKDLDNDESYPTESTEPSENI